VLATSRLRLGVTGEVVVPVGALSSEDGRALFAARAAAALPSFRLTEDNADAVAALCEALEGVPLAVELAAARIRVLSPWDILARLDDRRRLLTKGAPDAPVRQRSLRAALESTIELCTLDERLLWARLSVFTGGFALEAAERVCAGDGIAEVDVLDLVDGLLEKSVLVREDDGASYVRFRMPESLREYAAEQLTAERHRDLADRHLAWCADLVRVEGERCFGTDQARSYRTLQREHANLREGLRRAVADPRQAVRAVEMVTRLDAFWRLTGRLGEARHWLARALEAAPADPNTRAGALATAAWTATVQGDTLSARAALEEAEALVAGGTVDAAAGTRVLLSRAVEVAWCGRPAEAVTLLERAVTPAAAAGDPPLEPTAWLLLGLCRGFAGDVDGAGTALRACVDLTASVGETHLRSDALGALAMLALLSGDPGAAAEPARRALVMKADLGDRSATGFLLEVLAWVAAAERRPERAATLLGAAETRWQQLGVDPEAVPYLSVARRRCDQLAGVDRRTAGFRAAFRRGAALSEGQVLDVALDQVAVPDAPEEQVVLTRREVEVAHLVGRGLSNREVAEHLRISQRTVESHVDHILRKLGFGSRTQVVAWVLERESRL
jgi:non-specific serine/threonine protein kinase